MGIGVISYFLACPTRVPIKVTAEVGFDSFGQIRRITRTAQKPSPTFNNLFPERAHVSRNHWQAKAITKEQHPTLKDLVVRENHHIGCLEIQFHVFIWNELGLEDNLPALYL